MSSSSSPVLPTATPWATSVLALIDGVICDRVLVYGALPPEGGDLDLLARPAELTAIREALLAAGFLPTRRMLVRFRGGVRQLVELTPSSAWGLPSAELATLFTEARPLDGTEHLARPAAHHALLIRARKAARRRDLHERQWIRVEDILGEEPDAWSQAVQRAAAWQAIHALTLLRIVHQGTRTPPAGLRRRAALEQVTRDGTHGVRDRLRVMRALVPDVPISLSRVRPTRVIAFSGLDGSGKSTQARLLRDALLAAGLDVKVVWAGFGTNRSLGWIKAPAKRVLRALPRVGALKEVAERVSPRADGKLVPLAEPGKRERHHGFWLDLITQVWMTVMALANAYSMRKVLLRSCGRGGVVIFDRYTLDSAVRLRHWYGDRPTTQPVIRVLHLLNTHPLKAYFLDVPPQVAYARKPEWTLDDLECRAALYGEEYARLGVRRVDGTRPADDLGAEIAAEVWARLKG